MGPGLSSPLSEDVSGARKAVSVAFPAYLSYLHVCLVSTGCPHPSPVVESGLLGTVHLPPITYKPGQTREGSMC